MNLTAHTSQFAVFDDFLSKDHWEEVWKYMQYTKYVRVDEGGWYGAWKLEDGAAMRGVSVSFGKYDGAQIQFPTHTAIDLIIQAIVDHSKDISKQVGEFGKAWKILSAVPMLYPAGTGLYWHRDAAAWSGSFTYYAHPEWNVEWGGELLLADESTQKLPEEYGIFLSKPRKAMGLNGEASFGAHLDNRDANQLLLERGMGTYILPKPNRLVVIAHGNPHSVLKVRSAAGDRIRASISGFFLKKTT